MKINVHFLLVESDLLGLFMRLLSLKKSCYGSLLFFESIRLGFLASSLSYFPQMLLFFFFFLMETSPLLLQMF